MSSFFRKIGSLFRNEKKYLSENSKGFSIIEPKIIIPPQPSIFNNSFLQSSADIIEHINLQVENFFKVSVYKSIQDKNINSTIDLTHHLCSMHAVKLFSLLYYFSSVSLEEGDKRHADEINTLIYGDMQIYIVYLSWRFFINAIEIVQKNQLFFKNFSIMNYMENDDKSFQNLLASVAVQTNIDNEKDFSSENYDFFIDCFMNRKNDVTYSKVDDIENAANTDLDFLNKVGILDNKPYEMVNYIKLKDFFNNPFVSRNEHYLDSVKQTNFFKYLKNFRTFLYE